jgi:hypothetical protein
MPLRGEVVFLFAFDVGQEVVPAAAGPRFARADDPLDLRRRKTAPSGEVLYRPLAATTAVGPVPVGGGPAAFDARVYDAGVIAVAARLPFTVGSLAELRKYHDPRTDTGEPLTEVARRVCDEVRAALGNAVRGPTDTQGPEAYTVFRLAELGGAPDAARWAADHRAEVAGLLADLDPAAVSESQQGETFQHLIALERTDAAVIDWDAALVIDVAGGADEVLYVLEIANLQLQEWKVLDATLDRHLNHAYDHFARPPGAFSLGWGGVLRDLRRLRTDTARLTDEVSNISKFIGDWYLARVYRAATERFHLDRWRASLDHRLSQLDRVYGAMQSDANDRRMLWLEVVIVLLIAVELVLSLIARR